MSCFFRLQSSIQQTTSTKGQHQNKLFDIGKEDLANFSWVQPTYLVLLLIPQMHVLANVAQFKMEINQLFQWYKM